MESWKNPNILIAIYAAVVGSAALGWQIIQYFNERKGKIELELVEDDDVDETQDVTEVYDLYITNRGAKNRYIERPRLEYKSSMKSCEISLRLDERNFPIELKPHQKVTFRHTQQELIEKFPEKEENEEIQFFLFDTARRKYVSNWVKVIG